MSFYAMAFFGTQPLGGLIVGFSSQHIGVKNTVLIEGIIAMLIGCLRWYYLPKNRRKKAAATQVLQPKELELEVVDN
jgi:predicted MFS family arabinose efflux permease